MYQKQPNVTNIDQIAQCVDCTDLVFSIQLQLHQASVITVAAIKKLPGGALGGKQT